MRGLSVGISVADLVEDLGGGVLRLVAAPSDLRAPIDGVTLLDPSDPAKLERGHLVIGIGVLPGDRLLPRLAAAGAAGLVVRERVARLLAPEAERVGVPLLGVPEGADWARVVVLVSSVAARARFGMPDRPPAPGAGDLSVFAGQSGEEREARLTARELEVLRLVARGRSNQQVSDTLGIRLSTVERHLANVYPKLGVRSRTEAALYALRHELS